MTDVTEPLDLDRPDLMWDLSDRLRKAMRIAGIDTLELADYLGVHRSTVSGWTNGRYSPAIGMLRLVALRTGVPLEWLRDGVGAGGNLRWAYRGEAPTPTPVADLLPHLDSNQKPFD